MVRGWIERHSSILAAVVLLLALLAYLVHIDSWHMYDDEGGYLYAAWRISQGETPYRDFLTPQMPLFLYLGGSVMRLTGPVALSMRVVTVLTMLAAGALLYLTARETVNPIAALVSLVVFLVHRNVYYMARFFRPEAYMVFFCLLGLYLGVRSLRRSLRWLQWAAGIAFALATLCKLFGLLPFVGYLAYVFLRSLRSQGKWQIWTALRAIAGPIAGYTLVLALAILPLYLAAPDLPDLLLGHHLRQGARRSPVEVLSKGGRYLWNYALMWPVYIVLVLTGGWAAWRQKQTHPIALLWLAQLPTAGAMLLISRDLMVRLLVFLAPAESVLLAVGLLQILRFRRLGRVAPLTACLVLALALYPHLQRDVEIAGWYDSDTRRIAQQIGEWTATDEVVLCDYPGLNFFAQRRTTYLGAGLSGGAAGGGQILGADLARELESAPYAGQRWVVIDVGPESGHTVVALHDYGWFLGYLDRAGFELVDELTRGEQLLRVYRAPPQPQEADIPSPLRIQLGEIELLGYDLPKTSVQSGTAVLLTLYWRATEPVSVDYKVFIHVVDGKGNTVAQEDERGRYGWLPTYLWTPGPVIVEQHSLALPATLAPGQYGLGLGMYPWPDGARLAAIAEDGTRLPNDWVPLPVPVTVR